MTELLRAPISPSLVVLTVLVLGLVELAKAWRWRTLFGSGRPAFRPALRALVAGQLTNALMPIRAGEPVRLGLIVAAGAPLVPATAALAAAKAIDAICLGAIAFGVVGAAALGQGALGMAAAGAILGGGLLLAVRGQGLRGYLESNRVARKLRLASLLDVAQVLRDRRALANVFCATATVWLAGLAANVLVLQAVGIAPTLDLAARVIVVSYLAGMLPAPPGRLGVYEAGIVAALSSGGVDLADAAIAAVTLHVCQLVELALLFVASWAMARHPRPA